jgi:hypothetical protein
MQALANGGVSNAWAELGNLDGDVDLTQPNPMPNNSGEYPAVPVTDWHAVGGYYLSVWTGVQELITHLNHRYGTATGNWVSNCSRETLVLGGYSQGADVIGTAIRSGQLSQAVMDHIGYVALYGDPHFDPGTVQERQNRLFRWWVRGNDPGYRNRGYPFLDTVPNSGILGVPTPQYMPQALRGRVGSWCAYNDGICTGEFPSGMGVHSTEYQRFWIQDSTDEIANKAIKRRNLLNPGTTAIASGSYTPPNAEISPINNPPDNVPTPTITELDNAKAIWARQDIGSEGWARQSDGDAAKAVVAGGVRQSLVSLCDAVWSKDTLRNGGWTQETGCDSVKALRMGSTGTRIILDYCGAIWAKGSGIGFGGWVQEADCGSAKDIQIGGNRQVILDNCDAIWSKDGVGYGGWTKEADCGAGKAITVSSDGTRVIQNYCNALWAKSSGIGYGGWTQETNCDSVKTIVANGGVQLILDLCGALWAKPGTAGWGGWVQESGCYSAKAISVGSNGRQVLLSLDGAIQAKDGISYGGWHQMAGGGSSIQVSAG